MFRKIGIDYCESRRSNYPEIASPRTPLEPVYRETRSVHCPEGNRQLEQILRERFLEARRSLPN
jgi:hypothetical protein